MRKYVLTGILFVPILACANTKIEFPSEVGQPYLVYSEDPFLGTRNYKYMVVSSYLSVRCNKIELEGRDGYFNKFSFPAKMRFRVDGEDYDFSVKYNTVGISDSRYYSLVKPSVPIEYNKLIDALKVGNKAVVGGKWYADWEHRTIDLSGFTKAYNMLGCE
jgi:hypothetical protein